MSPRIRRTRPEDGAVAVMYAVLATLLLALGAAAVDLGHGFAKRSLLQTDVDVAVLAAAAELTSGGGCNPEVVAAAEKYLNEASNKVPGQPATFDLGGSADDGDGYISCAGWRVDLWAPHSEVDLGLGRLISEEDSLQVPAHAAAQIKAATGGATLPYFAVEGCNSGSQSIRNPSGEPAEAPVPELDPPSGKGVNATFTITPTSVAADTSSATVTLTGQGFKDVDAVGFTGPGAHETVTVPKVAAKAGNDPITVTVPAAVLDTNGVWYVRVRVGTTWSEHAVPFTVGDAVLYCDARNQGNFGTIELPRSDSNSANWLALNIIKGIQPTLAIHGTPNGECDGDPGSVMSEHAPVDGTNCVASETGLKPPPTNAGLVSGAAGEPGRLDTDSTSNCSRSGDNNRTAATVLDKHINDDLLSCFIINGARISDLVAGNATGTHALSGDIFDSPRFIWLPVLQSDPFMGRKWWPIVDFTPGFITDQSLDASKSAPGTITPLNGLESGPSGIEEVRVVLFSEAALPETVPAKGGEGDYTGSGPKALVLVE